MADNPQVSSAQDAATRLQIVNDAMSLHKDFAKIEVQNDGIYVYIPVNSPLGNAVDYFGGGQLNNFKNSVHPENYHDCSAEEFKALEAAQGANSPPIEFLQPQPGIFIPNATAQMAGENGKDSPLKAEIRATLEFFDKKFPGQGLAPQKTAIQDLHPDVIKAATTGNPQLAVTNHPNGANPTVHQVASGEKNRVHGR